MKHLVYHYVVRRARPFLGPHTTIELFEILDPLIQEVGMKVVEHSPLLELEDETLP